MATEKLTFGIQYPRNIDPLPGLEGIRDQVVGVRGYKDFYKVFRGKTALLCLHGEGSFFRVFARRSPCPNEACC